MKRITLAALLLTTLTLFSQPAHAKHPKAGRGIPGTVTEVARNYFLMDLANGETVKVFVTANTNIQLHGAPSDSSHVKPGVRVRVTGTTTDGGSTIESYKVNITAENEAHG